MAVLVALAICALTAASASAAETTYSAIAKIPVPPASSFAGSGGGDGWAVAFTPTSVYNVFHHQGHLSFACHLQSDASPCYEPRTVTDASGRNFGTSGQPGMYLDSAAQKLYVYATREDGTAGVVCADLAEAPTNTNPFCGFTALTAVGDAYFPGMSNLSDPQLIGSHLYSFNYNPESGVTGTRNKLLCFDVSTDTACAGQPYEVPFSKGTMDVGYFPEPATAAIDDQLYIPVDVEGKEELACFSDATQKGCPGSWPVALGSISYVSNNGAPFPLLSPSGGVTGVCLPTGTDPCFETDGDSMPTPANLASVVQASTGWNGPAVKIGPRVYLSNGNIDQIECFDYSTGNGCPHFPHSLPGSEFNYTVNRDPQRPTCIWTNADGGEAQIQNFDAYSGEGCGEGQIRALASQFVVDQPQCKPVSYVSLQVLKPPPSSYKSGTVAFEDADGNPVPGAADKMLDGTGSVNLAGLALNTPSGLPQFLITLEGESETIGEVEIELRWKAPYNPACVGEHGSVPKEPSSTSTQLSGGGKSGASISVPSGTAVTDTATISGINGSEASGEVSYKVYSDAACSSEVASGGEAPVSEGGGASSTALTLPVGTYYWQASYSGDAGNGSSVSTCGSEVETVEKAGGSSPTQLETSLTGEGASGATVTVKEGAAVTDSATLKGANASSASGSVSYTVYSDHRCKHAVASAGTVSVSGGVAPSSSPETLSPGTYYWQASYSGEANNGPSTSVCGTEIETVQHGESPPPEECTVAGSGRFRVNSEIQTVADKLSTNLSQKQTLKFKWNKEGKHELVLTSLTSASCTVTNRQTAFYGTGTASVDGVTGYGVTFKVAVTRAKKLVFILKYSRGREHMTFHGAAKANEVITTS